MSKIKIKKSSRIIGKIDGKRYKTTIKKWKKILDENPKSVFSMKEDEEQKIENKNLELKNIIKKHNEENEE